MVERVIEQREAPRDTVVVHDRDDVDRGSNTGLIIAAVIILLIVLLLIFGRGLIGGGGSSSPNVHVNVPGSSTSGQ